jgi:uncharacterized membrane protein
MIIEFIGKIHPLLVHLPIGIILLFIFLEFSEVFSNIELPKMIMRLIVIVGVFSGFASIISGYVLSLNGLNDGETLDKHKWIALATIISFTIYGYISQNKNLKKYYRIIALLFLLILLISTGHLGGKLTHGESYWDFITNNNTNNQLIKKTTYNVKNIDEAKIFDDLIMVSFQEKCIQCHGLDRQKGKLRLDGKEWILKGGDEGKIININDLVNSEILKRIFLDLDEEQHMPPKSKQQLSEEEKNIIEWWVNAGAPFDKKVSEIDKTSLIDSTLKAYHRKLISSNTSIKEEREKITPISDKTIELLIKSGWVVSPVSKTDNHLRLIGFNLLKPMDSSLAQLVDIKEHIIELKLSFQKIDNNNLKKIALLTNLEKLWLNNCSLVDGQIESLSNLTKLTYLNLSNNKISISNLKSLKNLRSLQKLYIQQIGIKKNEYNELKNFFPSTELYAMEDSMTKVISDTLFTKKIP